MSGSKLFVGALALLALVGYYHFHAAAPLKDTGDEEFDQNVLHSTTPVLVDFSANWCGCCQRLAPVLEKVAGNNRQVKFVKMDVDQHQDVAIELNVRAIPCRMLIKNGRIIVTVKESPSSISILHPLLDQVVSHDTEGGQERRVAATQLVSSDSGCPAIPSQ